MSFLKIVDCKYTRPLKKFTKKWVARFNGVYGVHNQITWKSFNHLISRGLRPALPFLPPSALYILNSKLNQWNKVILHDSVRVNWYHQNNQHSWSPKSFYSVFARTITCTEGNASLCQAQNYHIGKKNLWIATIGSALLLKFGFYALAVIASSASCGVLRVKTHNNVVVVFLQEFRCQGHCSRASC